MRAWHERMALHGSTTLSLNAGRNGRAVLLMSEYTLVGACGINGCLDCLPLFVVEYDAASDMTWEREVSDFHYTLVLL